MKVPSTLILAVSLAVSILSCKDKDDNETPTVPTDVENPLKAGEVSVPVKADPSFSWAPISGSVNLGDLKGNSSTEPWVMPLKPVIGMAVCIVRVS